MWLRQSHTATNSPNWRSNLSSLVAITDRASNCSWDHDEQLIYRPILYQTCNLFIQNNGPSFRYFAIMLASSSCGSQLGQANKSSGLCFIFFDSCSDYHGACCFGFARFGVTRADNVAHLCVYTCMGLCVSTIKRKPLIGMITETWHTSSPGQCVIDSEFTRSRVSGSGSASPRILRLTPNPRSTAFRRCNHQTS